METNRENIQRNYSNGILLIFRWNQNNSNEINYVIRMILMHEWAQNGKIFRRKLLERIRYPTFNIQIYPTNENAIHNFLIIMNANYFIPVHPFSLIQPWTAYFAFNHINSNKYPHNEHTKIRSHSCLSFYMPNSLTHASW